MTSLKSACTYIKEGDVRTGWRMSLGKRGFTVLVLQLQSSGPLNIYQVYYSSVALTVQYKKMGFIRENKRAAS